MLFNNHDIVNSRHHLELAWPDPETVRLVYQALGNFFQLPVGAGKDVSFDFDFEKFSGVYKMKPVTVFSSLKILERDGYLTLNDAWDDPSRIFFTCSKEDLYRYQLENVEADKVLRIILRSYSGVFTDFTRISENEIARRSGIDSPKVHELLFRMQKLGVIDYLQHKNTPQLIFNTERLNPNDISLSKTFYSQRKKEAFAMLESAVKYATSKTECRSRMLVAYFGETRSQNCEVCDVCLMRRRNELNEKQSKELEQLIFVVLADGPHTITHIVTKGARYKEKDVLAVLRWLIEDGRVQSEGEIIRLPGL
jgi:ATP-dependent DNA helicase RecQ